MPDIRVLRAQLEQMIHDRDAQLHEIEGLDTAEAKAIRAGYETGIAALEQQIAAQMAKE